MTFAEKILKSAEEGIVLLKNTDNVLPLKSEDNVSIFGRCQFDFYRCGTGSGGSVHVPYATNLTDFLSDVQINNVLSTLYRQYIVEHPFDDGHGVWAGEPFCQQDMDVSVTLSEQCAKISNKAVYVVGRTAGEDKDYVAEKESYYLSDTEWNNIKNVCKSFDDVIIVFNTSGIMDTSWTEKEEVKDSIKAIVYAWQGGQEAGRACANILTGKAVPSGKLSDTIALDIKDYPSTEEFAKKQNIYKEDIFVGYRYFNTFAKDKILYPFGYGLSYTDFTVENYTATVVGDTVKVTCDVTNIGKEYSGKQIVQVYYSVPSDYITNPAIELAGFAKTNLLAPGEKQTVEVSFKIKAMAVYDDRDDKPTSYCWFMPKGTYKIFAGTDSLTCKALTVDGKEGILVEENLIVEKLQQCCAPSVKFDRLTAVKSNDDTYSAIYEASPLNHVDMAKRIQQNLPDAVSLPRNQQITFDDVKKDRSLLSTFIAQLNVKELSTIVRGEGMMSRKVTPGIAAAFGGLSETLHSYKIPVAGCADGPSGLRMDNGKEANLMPIGTQLACSWNLELVEDLYLSEGMELKDHQIDALLGPGINIHRNPLNGRNFEYFSEDPLLTGLMAIVQIKGIYKGGSNATIKHFAVNSQETMRRDTDSVVSERALRQIYLKPFELSVKDGVLKSIMTSYNSINGHWAASNYDLVNMMLRKDWGYTGFVMTDWWADMNDCIEGGEQSLKKLSSMIKARNDIFMVVDNDGAENNIYGDDIEEQLKTGYLTLGELQLCVKDILTFILDAPVSKRKLRNLVDINEYNGISNLTEEEKKLGKVSVGDKFVIDEGQTAILNVVEKGLYDITASFLKEGDDVSQSVVNIFINGNAASSLECRSTMGKLVTVASNQVILNPGNYRITLEHNIKGIEIKELCFAPKPKSLVLSGVFK